MTQEMETAVKRLQTLSEGDQARIAEQINTYLTKLERLREMVQEGLASGPATPLDMDEVIRKGEERLRAFENRSAS